MKFGLYVVLSRSAISRIDWVSGRKTLSWWALSLKLFPIREAYGHISRNLFPILAETHTATVSVAGIVPYYAKYKLTDSAECPTVMRCRARNCKKQTCFRVSPVRSSRPIAKSRTQLAITKESKGIRLWNNYSFVFLLQKAPADTYRIYQVPYENRVRFRCFSTSRSRDDRGSPARTFDGQRFLPLNIPRNRHAIFCRIPFLYPWYLCMYIYFPSFGKIIVNSYLRTDSTI